MVLKNEYIKICNCLLESFQKAGIVLNENEKKAIEVADFGLGHIGQVGLAAIIYINTERVCSKELFLLPRQTCPEHMHIDVNGQPGKEETFRCRWGEVFLYVEGERAEPIQAVIPEIGKAYYTVWKEIHLKPGEQYTIYPNTKHWFQGGIEGAIISEFSTANSDETDRFTDPAICRTPLVEGMDG